ncbi:MAG: hypothetical protein PHT40_03975 [Patescibacteria group bacterium]|nr:hypothetical protein [Patescibacteria group bacterium]
MKTKITTVLIFLAVSCFGEIKFSGFGQVRYDSTCGGFFIQKARVFAQTQGVNGPVGSNVHYELMVDFVGPISSFQLVFGSVNVKFNKDWLPEIIVGRTLDGISYQFPGPAKIPVINYPAAYFNTGCGTGIYVREVYGKCWVMLGAINGTAGYKDDNKFLDFTGRVAYKLPFGFAASGVYQSGDQPVGYRKIYGGDLAWKWRGVWVNGGQNVYSFNGSQTARWFWSTVNVTKVIQLVGLVESFEKNGKTTTGWTAGANFNLTPKTVIRLDYFHSAKDENLKGWGVLFQQEF